jgi:hypothetical protein
MLLIDGQGQNGWQGKTWSMGGRKVVTGEKATDNRNNHSD